MITPVQAFRPNYGPDPRDASMLTLKLLTDMDGDPLKSVLLFPKLAFRLSPGPRAKSTVGPPVHSPLAFPRHFRRHTNNL